MKVKKDYLLRKIADSYVVVPVGKASVNFNGIINLNDTGAFIWEQLQNGTDEKTLIKNITSEYDIDAKSAELDLEKFLNKLKEADLLEK